MVKLNINISGKADIQFETDDSLAAVLEQERPMLEKFLTLLAQSNAAENNNTAKLLNTYEVFNNMLPQALKDSADLRHDVKGIQQLLQKLVAGATKQPHKHQVQVPKTVKRPRRPEEEYE